MPANQFSFGQGDEHVGEKSKPFKGEANRSYRISFAWWKGLDEGKLDFDSNAPIFAGANANFIPGCGYVINKGAEYTKVAGGEAPRQRIATVIIVWPTDKKGELDKSRLSEAEVKVWVISGDKFQTLKGINAEFPFAKHDFKATCSDAQYQKMTFTPCKDSVLAMLSNNEKAQPLIAKWIEKAQELAGAINDHIGREMTIQQIRDKLAGGGNGAGPIAPVDSSSATDLDAAVENYLDV